MSVTLKGNPIAISGSLPEVGQTAPAFTATNAGLEEVSLSDYAGKVVIISVVPSLDTKICDISTKKFNEEIGQFEGKVICLTVSGDLPMAQERWCCTADVKEVVTLSTFRDGSFGEAYGLNIQDGPIKGLLARAIIVLDGEGKVAYTELVPEIAHEPNYEAALNAAKGLI